MEKNTELAKVKNNPVDALEIASKFVEVMGEGQIRDNFMIVNDEGKKVFSKADAMIAITLGLELGLNPVTSLALGKDLKVSSIYSVDKGKAFGLSPLESIKLIHAIPNGKGVISIYIGVNLISKRLHDSGTRHKLTKDYEPVYAYEVRKSGVWVRVSTDRVVDKNGNMLPKFFLYDETTTQAEVDKVKEENKVLVQRVIVDYVTEWHFERDGHDPLTIPYYRSEAIKAGLLRVVDAKGAILQEGKKNWNDNERQMMRNRPLSIGGRLIAADYLAGCYEIHSESEAVAPEFAEYTETE